MELEFRLGCGGGGGVAGGGSVGLERFVRIFEVVRCGLCIFEFGVWDSGGFGVFI